MTFYQGFDQSWPCDAQHNAAAGLTVVSRYPVSAYSQSAEQQDGTSEAWGAVISGSGVHETGSSDVYWSAESGAPYLQSSDDGLLVLKPFACTTCRNRFSARKTLYRHMRTTHTPEHQSKFKCLKCGKACARKDILDRHVRTQHSAGDHAVTVQCELCEKWMRPRSLPAHQASAACRQEQQDNARRTSTPSYLPAIADPALLSAWLFVKFKPWGDGHLWLHPHHDPKQTLAQPSIEVMELRSQVYRTIIGALSAPNVDRDPALADAMAALIMVTCQIEGWNAARIHVQGFVRLADMQIKAAGGDPRAFAETSAIDAFRTVLAKDKEVARSAVPTCEGVSALSLQLLRRAAIDIISAPLMYAGEPVWLRVHYLDGHDWFRRYEQELLPIAALADSVTHASPHLAIAMSR